MNGKLLKDTDKISEIKLDSKSSIQAFISPRTNFDIDEKGNPSIKNQNPESRQDTSSSQQGGENIANYLGESRGFDYFKINGYTDEEIIWKRYTFHASYILSESLNKINDDQLFILEECFLLENQKYIKKPELFKFCEFRPEKKRQVLFIERLLRLLFVILGCIFGVLGLLAVWKLTIKDEHRYSYILGAVIQAFILILFCGSCFEGSRG